MSFPSWGGGGGGDGVEEEKGGGERQGLRKLIVDACLRPQTPVDKCALLADHHEPAELGGLKILCWSFQVWLENLFRELFLKSCCPEIQVCLCVCVCVCVCVRACGIGSLSRIHKYLGPV